MITPAQAEALIGRHVRALPAESLPLARCGGAVLREPVHAEREQPPFDRVAMDGIALDSAAVRDGRRHFRVEGTQAAGDAPLQLRAREGCLEAMTGAVLPEGCDAVVPVEQIVIADGVATLAEGVAVEPWRNVHRRGSDTARGALLLQAGTRLGPAEVAVAAGQGLPRLQVSAQPMVMVISTGNELVEPGEPLLPHQLRRSNAYGVAASLRRHGFTRVADDHVRDEPLQMRERLQQHLDTHDILILSGGVSMGKFDLVPAALAEIGVREVFHKVAQRPGKPLWFGVTDSGKVVFGLPGNPVSTLVGMTRYILPALAVAQASAPQRPVKVALDAPVATGGLTLFRPVIVTHDEEGRAWASLKPTNTSGDFSALAGTDGFVELPPDAGTLPRGHVTRLYPW